MSSQKLNKILHRALLIAKTKSHVNPDDPGKPEIITNDDGEVVEYTNSETAKLSGIESVDTGFIPFNGYNWEMRLHAQFISDEQSAYYPTILNAMVEVSPWNGFIVRYEGTQLYLVEKSNHWKLSTDSDGNIDMIFQYTNGTFIVTNNNTQICSKTIDYTIDGLTITIGSSVDSSGNPQRYAICQIYDFYVKRIN